MKNIDNKIDKIKELWGLGEVEFIPASEEKFILRNARIIFYDDRKIVEGVQLLPYENEEKSIDEIIEKLENRNKKIKDDLYKFELDQAVDTPKRRFYKRPEPEDVEDLKLYNHYLNLGIINKLISAKQCVDKDTFYQGVYSVKDHSKLLTHNEANFFLEKIHSQSNECKNHCKDLHLFRFDKKQ